MRVIRKKKEYLLCKSLPATAIFCFAFFLTPILFAAEISSKEFLSSDFATSFRNKEYNKALKESDALLKKYPQDSIILRYRALTLERLGRDKEAVNLYQEIIERDSDYAPAHMFLGLAYFKQGKSEKAAEELRWIIQNSPSLEYRSFAQAQLNRWRLSVRPAAKQIKKRPYMLGKLGVAYDSNPLLVPDDRSLLARVSKRDAALYLFDLDIGYPVRLEKDFRFDTLYIGQQRSHDNGARKVDFTSQGFALDSKKRYLFGQRAVLFGSRYDFRANFLRSDLFSIANRFFLSLDTSFRPRTRTHFYGRFSVSNYGPDGSDPPQTSRDGIRGGLGLTQYFYTAGPKKFFFLKSEINLNQTRGDNFIRRGALLRLGLHTLMAFFRKTDLDVSTGVDLGRYPEFVSLSSLDLRRRRDTRWDVYAGLTHYWKPNLATRFFYRFIKSDNRNDYFDRTRHIAGMEAVFSL